MTSALERAGKVIERHRLQHFASQVEAAGAGGTSAMSWRKVEKGANDVAERTLAAIDKAFGWPIGTTESLRKGELSEPPPPTAPRPDPATGVGGMIVAEQRRAVAEQHARAERADNEDEIEQLAGEIAELDDDDRQVVRDLVRRLRNR